MKKWIFALLLLIPSFAGAVSTRFNACTGCPDYLGSGGSGGPATLPLPGGDTSYVQINPMGVQLGTFDTSSGTVESQFILSYIPNQEIAYSNNGIITGKAGFTFNGTYLSNSIYDPTVVTLQGVITAGSLNAPTYDIFNPLNPYGIAFSSFSNVLTSLPSSLSFNPDLSLDIDGGNTGNIVFNPATYFSNMSVATSTVNAGMNTAGFVIANQHFLYVTAFGGSTLSTFDVTSATNPVMTNQQTSASLTGAEGEEISGRYLFEVSLTTNTFNVFDLANPAVPKQVASLLDNTNLNGAESLRIVGNYAYVTNFNSGGTTPGIAVVDISTPTAPKIVSTVTNSSITAPIYMQVRYPYIYVSNEDTNCKINVIDISSPTNPIVSTSTVIPGCTASLIGLELYGRYLYIADYDGSGAAPGLTTMDISTATVPVFVSSADYTGEITAENLLVLGNKMYGTSHTSGAIAQWDLTNPAHPNFNALLSAPGQLPNVDDIYANGNYIYVSLNGTGGKGGFAVINPGAETVPAARIGSLISDYDEVTHDLHVNRLYARTSLNGTIGYVQNQFVTGSLITNSLTVNSGGSSGQTVCWKTATTFGYCSSVVGVGGACTCN